MEAELGMQEWGEQGKDRKKKKIEEEGEAVMGRNAKSERRRSS